MSITAYMQAVLRNNKNNSLNKNDRFLSAAKRKKGAKVDYTFYDYESTEEDLELIRQRIKKGERIKTVILIIILIALLLFGVYAISYYLY